MQAPRPISGPISGLLAGLTAAVLLAAAPAAFAAPPVYVVVDTSNEALMDAATAKSLWKERLPAKVMKLYPVKQFGFLTEVEGGFDDAKVCIVTARATMLPRSGKNLILKPLKSAGTYGIKAGATHQQCKDLAKARLIDAIDAVRAELLPG